MGTATSTIVCSDIVGSGLARARVGDVDADALLRRHEQALGAVIAAHAGRVVRSAGDGLVAAFTSATEAVRAAVAMQRCVGPDLPEVTLRVGVAAGDVSWEDDDCDGLPVVVAARLSAAAEGGQVLVAGLVRQLVTDPSSVAFRPVGRRQLAGVQGPVECFEVAWQPVIAAGPTRPFSVPCPAPVAVAPSSAFVGRHAERGELDAAWADVRRGANRTVLVGGEAGAGKTRLAFEFARGCEAAGAAVLLGVCDTELAMPYQPWAHALHHLVRALPVDVRASLRDELAEVSVLVPQLERLVPGLRRPPSTDPETDRYRLFTAVDALLADASRRWPTIVLIDDLHWATSQTLALLRHLARSATASGLLVVGTFRDTGDEVTDPLASCLADLRRVEGTTRIRLGGLDRASVEGLVSQAVCHELDDELRGLAATITERSAGNPFLVGELWRHLVAAGAVARAGGRWAVQPTRLGVGVPDSVLEVVTARLTRLSPPARRVVELMAVAGQQVERRVVVEAVGLPADEAGRGLDELVEAKLLTEVGGLLPTFQFVHAIVRDTVEELVAPSVAAVLHGRVAAALEAVHEADRRPVLAELARHFTAAARADPAAVGKAVYYSRRAAAQAMRSVAYDEAIVHLGAALALSPQVSRERVEILLDLATARTRHGHHRDAITTFGEAFRASCELGDVAAAAQAAAGFDAAIQLPGLPGGPAVEMVSEALALVGDEEGPLRTRLQASLARALALAGRTTEAAAVGGQALAAARRGGDPEVLMAAVQAALAYGVGPRDYTRYAEELGEIAARVGDPWAGAYAVGCEVRGLLVLGAVGRARRRLAALERAADEGRFLLYRYMAMAFEVMVALIDGRFEDAERLAAAAHAFGESAQTEFDAGVHGVQMYVIRREQGRLAEVAPVLRLAAALQPDAPVWRPGLAALLAEVGMLDEARREFERLAPDGFAAVPRDAMWPCCLTFLSEVCVALGDRARAEVLLRQLEPYRGTTVVVGFTVCLGPAERLMGALAALVGRRVDAEAHFAAALELAERAGSPPWRSRVQHDWAAALGGRPDLAAAALATARELGMSGLVASCEALAAAPTTTGRRPGRVAARPDQLSAREVEVLQLVAAGLSNREIGRRLFISANTAANHVRAILQKTHAANRAEAAAYAVRHDLLP